MFFEIGVLKISEYSEENNVLGPVFNNVTGLQPSCEYCEFFKNRFFHKTSLVAASEKFINFPGNIAVAET